MSQGTYDNPATSTTDSKLVLITQLWQSAPEEWTATTHVSPDSCETTHLRTSTEMGPTDVMLKHFDGLGDLIADSDAMETIRQTYGQQRRLAGALQHLIDSTQPFSPEIINAVAVRHRVSVNDLIAAATERFRYGPKDALTATPAEDVSPRSLP